MARARKGSWPYRLQVRWQWYWFRWALRRQRRLTLPVGRAFRVFRVVIGLCA